MLNTLEFQATTIEDRITITKYLDKLHFKNSELSFTNIFSWAKPYNTVYTTINGLLLLKSTHGYANTSTYSFPIGEYVHNDENLKNALSAIIDNHADTQPSLIIRLHDKIQVDILEKLFPNKFIITKDIDAADYVYTSEALINLKGKKLHSKKNHINKFKSLYNYEYRPLTSNDIPAAKELFCQWSKSKADMDNLSEDFLVAFTLFDNFESLKIKGGGIFVDNQLIAFSFGEALNSEMVDIHAEYANADYEGIFPMINQQFVENTWSQYKYINREDDMGLEGLRRAKRSYQPTMMIEKFFATIK